MDKKLSIIMPCFKAEKSIKESLVELKGVLDSKKYEYEIICVIDGKVDNSFEIAKKLEKKIESLKVYAYQRNKGKGYAVRYGFKKAKGDIIGFIDEGGEIRPESLLNLFEVYNRKKADIVVGSKRHRDSKVNYPFLRKLVSNLYSIQVKLLFEFEIKDTQAGIKLFSKTVVDKILPELKINGFAFDVEMLLKAKQAGFNKIYEAPIFVYKKSSEQSSISYLNFFKASFAVFFDTLRLYISK